MASEKGMGQEVKDYGAEGKVPNNDALNAEKSKETGAAQAVDKPFDTTQNIPRGQKIIG